ncbi:hypothetical protein O181_070275 [Austropuccinia psidii MF-1]|uniref:Uncharacterized protein n=1 Tax=Austropuccinia psidii MF-1 TaxID=1389203 RepID=A0A9Q3I8W6_9BASI|nr:hypothetical protein [Austropuccinia psidii MF-1]
MHRTKLTKSLVPSLPREQTLWKPTPGPSGTQWLEDLFRSKQRKFYLISTFNSSELTLPPFVEPSQTNEPPFPGPSPSSKPHEDVPTHEPEPELVPLHPHPQSSLTICPLDPPPSTPTPVPSLEIPPIAPENPTAYSPHSHNEALQEFADMQQTLMIPRAIIHESINQILLEHHLLLHMIPFADATD